MGSCEERGRQERKQGGGEELIPGRGQWWTEELLKELKTVRPSALRREPKGVNREKEQRVPRPRGRKDSGFFETQKAKWRE